MEPAWEKTCGRKFALTSRTLIQPNGGTREEPCFYYHARNGRRKMESRLVWTEKGRKFVIEIIKK